MHMRITWGRVKPGCWDDYEVAYKAGVADVEPAVPGLRGRLLIRDVEDPDAGGTLSLWESADAARAYEEGAVRRSVLPQLEQYFIGEFVTHVCEVRLARGELGSAGS